MSTAKSMEAYKNLLIWQYRNLPKARGTLDATLAPFLASGQDEEGNTDSLAKLVEQAFCLDTATGVQLDILGKYIGLSRTSQSLQSFGMCFAYMPAATPSVAFPLYIGFSVANPAKGPAPVWRGHFISTKDRRFTRIDDDTYRTLLKFKIMSNNSDGSMATTDAQLYAFFGTSVEVAEDEDKDMAIVYRVKTSLFSHALRIANEKKLLPRPAGVDSRFVFEDGSKPCQKSNKN